jgi:hypothetical protein
MTSEAGGGRFARSVREGRTRPQARVEGVSAVTRMPHGNVGRHLEIKLGVAS